MPDHEHENEHDIPVADDSQAKPQFPFPQNQSPNGQPQTSGKAIASMVLGICSIVTCIGYGIIGIPCGIIAIVFAKKARLAVQAGTAPASSLGMATAGRVCGWIGLILSSLYFIIIVIILLVAVFGAAAAAAAGNAPVLLP